MRGAAILAVAAASLLGGCSDWLPPKPVRATYDFAFRHLKGYDPYWRCEYKSFGAGVTVLASKPDRQCYSWASARQFSGIYIHEFEGQRFLENAKPSAKYAPTDQVWFRTDQQSDLAAVPALSTSDGKTRIWSVSFIGRKTAAPSYYDHLGLSNSEVLVDRLLAARLIGTYEGELPDTILDRRYPSSDNRH